MMGRVLWVRFVEEEVKVIYQNFAMDCGSIPTDSL
jgi:hypothetical protein